MKPQKIANLDQRLAKWNEERRDWFFQKLPMVLIIGIIVCCGMTYLVSLKEPSLKSTWFLWGFIFGVGLAITPLKVTYPAKPSQADVDADVALRKAFNMDATVSDKQG